MIIKTLNKIKIIGPLLLQTAQNLNSDLSRKIKQEQTSFQRKTSLFLTFRLAVVIRQKKLSNERDLIFSTKRKIKTTNFPIFDLSSFY